MTTASGNKWAGWIMVIIGAIDFFEGLIAVIRDQYYVFGPQQIIVFDMTTWGWITIIWGIIIGLAGLGLLAGASWARWFTIVVASINVIGQLGSFGNQAYPLWALASITLTIVVLYALIVRWGPAQEEIVQEGM